MSIDNSETTSTIDTLSTSEVEKKETEHIAYNLQGILTDINYALYVEAGISSLQISSEIEEIKWDGKVLQYNIIFTAETLPIADTKKVNLAEEQADKELLKIERLRLMKFQTRLLEKQDQIESSLNKEGITVRLSPSYMPGFHRELKKYQTKYSSAIFVFKAPSIVFEVEFNNKKVISDLSEASDEES